MCDMSISISYFKSGLVWAIRWDEPREIDGFKWEVIEKEKQPNLIRKI